MCLQAQTGEGYLNSPPSFSSTSPCSSPHTGLLRFSSLGEGGIRSSSFVKLVEWLGFLECSSGPCALCLGGRVKHRALALERGCWDGGPFSTNSSVEALCCWASRGCVDDADACVCVGDNGLGEADDEGSRETRGISVDFCWNLVRLVEWLGLGRL